MKHIAVVLGTRPEIIKLAEIMRLLKKEKSVKTSIIFTGQHYDYTLFRIFMQQLQLPRMDVNLGVSGGTNAGQVASMLQKLASFLSRHDVDIVVAQGDTNSVAAAALAAFYCGKKFAHVEAGLRSHDWRMPEEANRIVADSLSHYAFAPTRTAVRNLRKGACRKEAIRLTGNTIVEAVQQNLRKAKKSRILQSLGLQPERYALLTGHRQEYVDSKKNLVELLQAADKINLLVVFPIHPRTVKNLKRFGLWKKAHRIKNLRLVEPLGYFDFLQLACNSMFLLSDSGGIQEEASIYKKYVIVLRDFTERPEILGKFGRLAGYDKKKIVRIANRVIRDYTKTKKRLKRLACPFGDGKASKRIVKILLKKSKDVA